ncbi:MAG: macrocin O-methyltransferase [Sphingobacteriia bacterium]|nr:MAG: macrocin O-methyltransferase [Sphingobacteriia bacterium]
MAFKPIKAWRTLWGQDKSHSDLPPDFEPLHQRVLDQVRPFTMTSPARIFGLVEGVKYVIQNNIPGDFVECGVWKGGSSMAMAATLLELGVTNRKLWLFDTFEGMTAPGQEDVDQLNRDAASQLAADADHKAESVVWAYSGLAEVKANLARIAYPSGNIHWVQGDILQTVPGQAPEQIALLRLDTDWYASTAHEMKHLYPRLSAQGVLIVDDYGFWKGSRQAVDEYLQAHKIHLLLNRMDETGRMAIKPNQL